MLFVLFLGISTAIAWSFADIFIAKSTETVKPVFASALVNCIGAILFALYYLIFIHQAIQLNMAGIVFSIVAGLFITVAASFFFIGLHKGPVGIVSAISSTYPAVTLAIAIGFFGAKISVQQGVGIGLVLIGITAVSGLFTKTKQKKPKPKASGPLIAIVAAVCWGMGYGLLAEGVNLLGWQAASLLQLIALTVCYLIVGFATRKSNDVNQKTFKSAFRNPFILRASIIQLIGVMTLNIGLGLEGKGGSIVVALSACYPILTIVLSSIYFKERVSFIALAGGLLGIIGIVTLSLS